MPPARTATRSVMAAIHHKAKIFGHCKPAPKGWLENLDYRRAILRAAQGDEGMQAEIRARCAEDPIWYCDTFAYTYSPKDYEDCPDRLFILYDFQEDAIKKLIGAIGKHDALIEKARDMGASWLCLRAMYQRWRWHRGQSFLLASRKEEYVDKSGDPKSLFWKLDYFLKTEPEWLRPRQMERIKLHLQNFDMDCVFDGESTNKDIGTGDRRTAILLDEFSLVEEGHSVLAATQHVTRCRLFNATPKGARGAYYDRMKKMKEKHPEHVVAMYWWLHPERRPGLYTTVGNKPDGEVNILDKTYRFPKNYPFIRDGKMRSPWYDNECDRSPNQQLIAQELDINYHESGWTFFDKGMIDAYVAQWTRPPIARYEIDGDVRSSQPFLIPQKDGRLRFWISPDAHDVWHFDDDEFSIGCDVATGKGGCLSSNSSASVVSKKKRAKVAQFWSNQIRPYEFAQYVACMGRFFSGRGQKPALIIWEANGPGEEFTAEIVKLKYPNIFMRESETQTQKKKSKEPGWWSGKDTKRILLSSYFKELQNQTFVNPCLEAMKECEEYEQTPDGTIFHGGSKNEDSIDAGENHGDMVISDALACRGLSELGRVERPESNEPPPGSWGARRQRWQEEDRRKRLANRY